MKYAIKSHNLEYIPVKNTLFFLPRGFCISVCGLTVGYDHDTSSTGGMYIPAITSSDDCYRACSLLDECVGCDTSGPNYTLCWLHFDPIGFRQKFRQHGVIQTSFYRCPVEGKMLKCYRSDAWRFNFMTLLIILGEWKLILRWKRQFQGSAQNIIQLNICWVMAGLQDKEVSPNDTNEYDRIYGSIRTVSEIQWTDGVEWYPLWHNIGATS